MSMASAKIPAAVVSGIICLILGAGATFLTMTSLNQANPEAAANPNAGDNAGKDTGPADSGSKAGPPGMGKGGKGGKGGGAPGGGGRGPSPKMQLAQLVSKLDVLTGKPLTVQLTSQQKQEAKDLLAGLDTKEELTDDEAKAKLDSLLKILDSQKDTFEAAGYRWPGQGGGGGGGQGGGGGGGGGGGTPPANPFKNDQNAAHLKSLQTTLGK